MKKITGDKKQAAQQRQKNAQQVRKQQRAQQLAKRRQIDVKASKPKKRMLFKSDMDFTLINVNLSFYYICFNCIRYIFPIV